MKQLDLSKCKTNEEVCKLVSQRIGEISYEDLLAEVNKKFVFQASATKAIYTGLLMNMNVFLSGPGGYGKSELIKFILNTYKIPFHSIIGYKDMPVDALLGIPNMDMLLKESKYELNFKESTFCTPGILIGEEFTDILPSTAAALKDILTERGFRSKGGKVESLISTMIIAANKSAKEVINDESKKAFYSDRFPLQVEVKWLQFKARDYYALLRLTYPKVKENLLYFMASLFANNHEEHGNTVSPRMALAITDVYLSKGIRFIDNFSINTDSIENIRIAAEREFNKKTVEQVLLELEKFIRELQGHKEFRSAVLYTEKKLNALKVSGDLAISIQKTKDNLDTIYSSPTFYNMVFQDIDKLFNSISND